MLHQGYYWREIVYMRKSEQKYWWEPEDGSWSESPEKHRGTLGERHEVHHTGSSWTIGGQVSPGRAIFVWSPCPDHGVLRCYHKLGIICEDSIARVIKHCNEWSKCLCRARWLIYHSCQLIDLSRNGRGAFVLDQDWQRLISWAVPVVANELIGSWIASIFKLTLNYVCAKHYGFSEADS